MSPWDAAAELSWALSRPHARTAPMVNFSLYFIYGQFLLNTELVNSFGPK